MPTLCWCSAACSSASPVAEALYADLGHFGRTPIRLGWCVVFPALVVNYAGQAAIVLGGGPIGGNLFFSLCPAPVLLLPLVILATIATAVASQAVITGAFSMTRQATQLGCPCNAIDPRRDFERMRKTLGFDEVNFGR